MCGTSLEFFKSSLPQGKGVGGPRYAPVWRWLLWLAAESSGDAALLPEIPKLCHPVQPMRGFPWSELAVYASRYNLSDRWWL